MSHEHDDLYFDYLSKNVMQPFYEKRLKKLQTLRLNDILKRKNPYLFKAKNIVTAGEFVTNILDAFLSSQEETIFGDLLEGFAIFISNTLYGGVKSQFQSIDLEFQREKIYYIVSIKSGPSWGNSDQISQMQNNFKLAKSKLRQKGNRLEMIAVNGCIYGKDGHPFKESAIPEKSYYKYCGQEFWEFISDDDMLYQNIITPIDQEAKKKDEIFKEAYAAKNNEMAQEFMEKFVGNYQIDWIKLIEFVSKKPV